MIEQIRHHDQMLALILRASYHANASSFSLPAIFRNKEAI